MGSSAGGVPPGFRFHPTDEELLHYYLKKKVSFQKFDMEVIREVDLNKMEPWDLQERCKIGSTQQSEWYLFSHKDKKYPTGSRTNRATKAGFWKATGRDKCIRNSFSKIGMRKTLVFYLGRAPHGQKTDWIMHEYRLEDANQPNSTEDGWVVCRVFKKKNLFEVGNSTDGSGGSSMNSSDQQEGGNASSSTNHHHHHYHQSRTNNFMHGDTQYLALQQPFELNKQPAASELLGIHHHPHNHHHYQYSLFQSHHQRQNLMPPPHNSKTILTGASYHDYSSLALPSDQSPVMLKQLISDVNARDAAETGTNESLRFQACDDHHDQPGLDTAHHQQIVAAARGEAGLNEWAMLDDRIVTSHLGNEDSTTSKGVGFQEPNNVNPLSLRPEMDFWGYGK